MCHQHYLEAVETVLAWDLPDEALADALSQQIAYINNQGDADDHNSQLQ